MIEISKIDKLIQYIVLVAGQKDEAFDRELGPIHLIKYLYLSDLAYAASHEGRTYTGLPWRFHHHGPYCQEAFQRLEPALRSMLNATPGDPLDFKLAKTETAPVETAPATEYEPLTRRQEKKRSEQLSQLKSKLKERLSTRVQPKFKYTAPRYDEIFFQGLEQLDAAVGESIDPGDYRASFSEDIWKSKARSDPGSS